MESAAKMVIGKAYDVYSVPLNTYIEVLDVNDRDFGLQGFVMKQHLDAGVAQIVGSPVGSTQASGGKIVTPDQSDAGAAGVLGRGGGIAQFINAAGTTSYGWTQCLGIGRTIMKTTGALAANDLGVWSGDDTVAAFTDPGNEEQIFVRALVAASGGSVAAGGYLLL